MGLLNEVTQVISRQLNVNIRKLTIETEDGIFEGKISVSVKNKSQLDKIMTEIKLVDGIKKVSRTYAN